MSRPAQAPFLHDPVTVPRRELIEHYRSQAARASAPDISRDFKDIARQYELLAARVELRALAGQRQRDQSSAAEPQKQR